MSNLVGNIVGYGCVAALAYGAYKLASPLSGKIVDLWNENTVNYKLSNENYKEGIKAVVGLAASAYITLMFFKTTASVGKATEEAVKTGKVLGQVILVPSVFFMRHIWGSAINMDTQWHTH